MGRLQRQADSNTTAVTTFLQVVCRHGVLMGSTAIVLALTADGSVLTPALAAVVQGPLPYVFALAVIVGLFLGYLRFRSFHNARYQWPWIAYLFYISVVEEMAFRLYLPAMLESAAGATAAVLLSNALFAALHYFTLRWKFSHCVVTGLGGVGLSRLLETSGDLMLVILVHFIATFLNTPRAPEASSKV